MTPLDPAGVASQTALLLMTLALVLHIAAGTVGIVSGYIAVLAPKGRKVHRVAGTAFFASMLVMASFAVAMALVKDQPVNIMAGSIALYMVFTAWLAVRRPGAVVRGLEIAAFVAALLIAAYGFSVGMQRAGSFAGVVATFAALAALAAIFDGKVILQGRISRVGRISRHLWRMCIALFVATASFFLGQMDEIPQMWRGPHLYVLAFAPLVLLLIWIIRVRIKSAPKPVMVASGA